MKTTFVSGILCAALAIQLPSGARTEEPKPWFVRWVKLKAQRGIRLADFYKLIDLAHRGNAARNSPVRDSQTVDVEFPKAPLDDLIGNGQPIGDKGAKLFFDRGRLRMK